MCDNLLKCFFKRVYVKLILNKFSLLRAMISVILNEMTLWLVLYECVAESTLDDHENWGSDVSPLIFYVN